MLSSRIHMDVHVAIRQSPHMALVPFAIIVFALASSTSVLLPRFQLLYSPIYGLVCYRLEVRSREYEDVGPRPSQFKIRGSSLRYCHRYPARSRKDLRKDVRHRYSELHARSVVHSLVFIDGNVPSTIPECICLVPTLASTIVYIEVFQCNLRNVKGSIVYGIPRRAMLSPAGAHTYE